MAKKDKNTRFVRIGGRIVPIKVKPGSGSQGGAFKAAGNLKQTAGQALITGGSIAAVTSSFLSESMFGKNKTSLLDDLFVATTKKKTPDKVTNIKSMNKKTKRRLKRLRVASGPSPKTTSFFFGVTKAKVLIGGLATVAAGIGLKLSGDKKRKRESTALNRERNKKLRKLRLSL